MAGQPILALVSLVLLAGAIVMQFFIILSGAVNGSPENKVFFLQASFKQYDFPHGTDGVAWTYFALCPISNGQTHNCGPAKAALPFDPPNNFNFGAHDLVPPAFIDTKYYYLMSRFAWAFYLIALVFAVFSLFTGLLALCSRIGGFISGLTTCLAVVFQALAAALMTTWTVKGRNAFNKFNSNSNVEKAYLGKYAYGFSWGAFAALVICMVLFCVSGAASKKKDASSYESSRRFFGRKRSTRSRDGVKSEYS